jgi:hypothetical protein
MTVMNIPKFEHFFRVVASLDVDKADLKRYSDFVSHKTYDLVVRAQETARENGRRIIEVRDLPITKGLRQRVLEFRKINEEEVELKPILDNVTPVPPLELSYSAETEAELPYVGGGLSVALAHSFKIIDPDLKNPHSIQ